MNRLLPTRPWVLWVLLLVWIWGCAGQATPMDWAADDDAFDEGAFWERFPLPDDAEEFEAGEGFDLGFATPMIEPELFDFYAAWLSEQGWRRQAPTEAMVTLPQQIWRNGGAELRIEIRGLDEEGRTIVWLQMEQSRW